MTLMELGALGEFLGAIGVIVTLAYLAVQIRQNTRAMEEGKRLALAQAYQMRADALQEMMVTAANSQIIGPIIIKLTELGYPEDISALDALTVEERGRFRLWHIAQQTHWDNMFYQYQQGFLDPEYYEDEFRVRVSRLAPTWAALGLTGERGSFRREVAQNLKDHATSTDTPE
ncbi:MAG: hypothetical protein O7F71_09615 [Gammaproteobacteria bacterium]|nr:hypothetical protein [Gammaproteobacteria bacterium]